MNHKRAEQVKNACIGRAAELFEKENGRKPDLFSPEFLTYQIRVANEMQKEK